jgi:16S rRNA (guanine527-N7)-methyltransferase
MPMSKAGKILLTESARNLGLRIEPQTQQFAHLYDLLNLANQTTNLTAIRDETGIVVRHFLDSLTCLLADTMEGPQRLVDVGAGPGFPGLPLKLARPQLELTFLEASQKKVGFIEHTVQALNLQHVTAIWGRAEDLAHDAQYREQFDLATARALSSLPTVCELCLPFLRVGGRLIAMKGPEVDTELEAGERAANLLGGAIKQDIALELPTKAGPRRLIVVEKTAPSPPNYPRRAGIPERKPLK